MKIRFLPPLLSLAAGLAWIGYQHRRLETLAQEDAGMRQQIAAAQHSRRTPAEEAGSATPAHGPKAWKAVVKDHQIRWDLLAKLLGERRSILTDIRLEVLLNRQFATMPPAAIEAEYERMEAMELSYSTRQELQQWLIQQLADKDPAWVVQHLNPEESGMMSLRVENTFGEWLGKDMPGALAWMDRQIAAGGFDQKAADGGNGKWVTFENLVFPRLYETDPAAAFARLEKLPQELRPDALRGVFPNLESAKWQSFMDSARASLTESGYGYILETATQSVVSKGLEQMDELITAAHATAEERDEMVKSMVMEQFSKDSDKLPDTGSLDALLAWGMKQAPGSISRSMGEALGLDRGDFHARAELALHYAQQGGDGDALLAEFLQMSSPAPAEAGPIQDQILDRISDETLRSELRNQLQSQADRRAGAAESTPK